MERGLLDDFTLAYETYGDLNPSSDNAILICHALTGDHHAAGVYSEDDKKPGWWNHVVGPGKTNRYKSFFCNLFQLLGEHAKVPLVHLVEKQWEKPMV